MNLDSTISNTATIVASRNQVSSDLADEVVILSTRSGTYYGLNEVGSRIWHLIQQPRTLGEVRDFLLQEYDVETEQCERDLLILLQGLVASGLIEVNDVAAA